VLIGGKHADDPTLASSFSVEPAVVADVLEDRKLAICAEQSLRQAHERC